MQAQTTFTDKRSPVPSAAQRDERSTVAAAADAPAPLAQPQASGAAPRRPHFSDPDAGALEYDSWRVQ